MKQRALPATAPLPLFSAFSRQGGNVASLPGLISALLLFALATPATANESLNQQIDRTLHGYFAAQLADKAAAEGWQGIRFTQKVFALPEGSPTEPCPQALQMRDVQPWVAAGRQRLTLTCPAQPQWSIDVTAQAYVFIQAVVAAQVLEREQLITPGMLEYKEVALTRQNQGLFNHIEEVAGLSAKRRTRSQQVLTRDMLVAPWLVRRGERVKVTASHGDISARTAGEALQDGRKGMVIRVRNIASGKVIEAQVTGPGSVSSTFERPEK